MPAVAEQPLLQPRPIRVISVGAGLGGMHLARQIQDLAPSIQHQVYERLDGVGGTWRFSRYPGVGCDVPSHGYTLSWAPWPEWSRFVSSGDDCLKYAEHVAGLSGIHAVTRFRAAVESAHWNEGAGKWKVALRDLVSGEAFYDEAEVFINATGAFSRSKLPPVSGLDSFRGQQAHTAHWDLDPGQLRGKRVAVVGGGSSGAQVTGAMPGLGVASCDVYVKSKSWLAPDLATSELARLTGRDETDIIFSPPDSGGNPEYSESQKDIFRRQPEELLLHRANILQALNSAFAQGYGETGSKFQRETRPLLEAWLRAKLARKPELHDLFLPEFSLGCRRPVAGNSYIEALCNPVVNVVRKSVKEADATGLIDEDGTHRPYDVIVWATGYHATWKPPFEVVGRHNARFDAAYEADPRSFLIVHSANMPNYFSSVGPFTASLNGDFLGAMEKAIDSIVKYVMHLQERGYKSVCVKEDALHDFTAYADEFLKRAVQSEGCSAWYKQGTTNGPLRSIWPGTSVHSILAIGALEKDPPWEYFDWEPMQSGPARFAWLGNGRIQGELDEGADLAFYHRPR